MNYKIGENVWLKTLNRKGLIYNIDRLSFSGMFLVRFQDNRGLPTTDWFKPEDLDKAPPKPEFAVGDRVQLDDSLSIGTVTRVNHHTRECYAQFKHSKRWLPYHRFKKLGTEQLLERSLAVEVAVLRGRMDYLESELEAEDSKRDDYHEWLEARKAELNAAPAKPAWVPYSGQRLEAGAYWVHTKGGDIRSVRLTADFAFPQTYEGGITDYIPIQEPEKPE